MMTRKSFALLVVSTEQIDLASDDGKPQQRMRHEILEDLCLENKFKV